MLGASFLPARFRSDHGIIETSKTGYFSRRITPILQSVSRKAFTHPIHTIVFVALLASTSYLGALEGSLLDHTSLYRKGAGGTDLNSLSESGRRLRLGEQTAWKWQMDTEDAHDLEEVISTPLIPFLTLFLMLIRGPSIWRC